MAQELFNIDKEKDFSEWYTEILKRADIADVRYPVKGFIAYHPYGNSAMKKIMRYLEDGLERTGHLEGRFPIFIPKSVFGKEAKHLAGFEEEVYWVNKAGLNNLEEPLVVRPTSETAMYPMFSLWIRSYSDLPMRIFQTLPVYRYETRATRPLIRSREIAWFNEAHTAHATAEDASKQMDVGRELYNELHHFLGVPYIEVKSPKWELFPGAAEAYEYFVRFPDGRFLESGSVNNLAQSFSKVYDVGFEGEDGERHYAYQTCYGVSERLLACTMSYHGDNKGLIFLPEIATIQVIIVPILFEGAKDDITKAANKIQKELWDNGIRAQVDNSDKRPGEKFYYWEMKGVPVRIELGPKDLEKKSVMTVRRDTGEKKSVKISGIKKELPKIFEKMSKDMRVGANDFMKKHITYARTMHEIEQGIKDKNAVYFGWCGLEKCAEDIEKGFAVTIIGEPQFPKPEKKLDSCASCGNKAKVVGVAVKDY
ncbi:MAG: proline--tRNA ligase [Candidatus Diapherotrites archaeon]|nr:proline--tRNA ligase [Candidatus Diapherotrites archaeon]